MPNATLSKKRKAARKKAQRKAQKAETKKRLNPEPTWKTLSGHVLRYSEMTTEHIWNAIISLQRRIDKATALGTAYGGKDLQRDYRILRMSSEADMAAQTIKQLKVELRRRREPADPISKRLDAANRLFRQVKHQAYDLAWQALKLGYKSHTGGTLYSNTPLTQLASRPPLDPLPVDVATASAWMAFHGHGTYEQFIPPIKRKTKRR